MPNTASAMGYNVKAKRPDRPEQDVNVADRGTVMKSEEEIRARIDDYKRAAEDEQNHIAALKQDYENAEALTDKVSASVDIKAAEAKIDRLGVLADELEWVLG